VDDSTNGGTTAAVGAAVPGDGDDDDEVDMTPQRSGSSKFKWDDAGADARLASPGVPGGEVNKEDRV
jgi:hypothetical protein